jgi:hypothetical protein
MSEASSSSSGVAAANAAAPTAAAAAATAAPASAAAAATASSSQTKIAQKTWEMSNNIMEVSSCMILKLPIESSLVSHIVEGNPPNFLRHIQSTPTQLQAQQRGVVVVRAFSFPVGKVTRIAPWSRRSCHYRAWIFVVTETPSQD